MPIEIRELIIKTEVSSSGGNRETFANERELHMMRERLLDECKKMIAAQARKDRSKR